MEAKQCCSFSPAFCLMLVYNRFAQNLTPQEKAALGEALQRKNSVRG
jgi:hypothetical protein